MAYVLAPVERNLPPGVLMIALPRIVQLQFFDDLRTQRRNAASALLKMYLQSDVLPTQIFVFVREAQSGSFQSLQSLWNQVPVRFMRGLFSLGTQLQQRRNTMGDEVIAQPARLRQVLLNVLAYPEEEGLIFPPDQVLQLEIQPVVIPQMVEVPVVK